MTLLRQCWVEVSVLLLSTSHAIISELDLKRNFTRRNFPLCPSRCKNYEPSPAFGESPDNALT